jgi:1,4-dihydroxy-2-naphthoate octaprenyltransferase
MTKALIHSMRLRTLPLSLAGVVCGGLLAQGEHGDNGWAFALVLLTACALQVLSNLSNEMGDHLSGVDGEGREGPNYSMTDGGLTVKQMWRAINVTVVACCVIGLAMVLVSGSPWWVLLLGAAAIWAATHYTLGKKPYGYIGLGDLFVFIFFGLVSVLGSYFVVAHTIDLKLWLLLPAVGVGLLSVAVLNVNNIRDMQSDEGIRRTVPLRIGVRNARIYQTVLVVGGYLLMLVGSGSWWPVATAAIFGWHLHIVWHREGRQLDPALPLLVLTTFATSVIYALCRYGL